MTDDRWPTAIGFRLSAGRGQRQAGGEAAAGGGAERDRAAVELRELADDREAKAGAGGGLVGPDAALQDGVAQGGIETGTVVFDGDLHGVVRTLRRHRHAPARPLARVVEKVA